MTTQHDDLAMRAGLTSGADTWHTKDAAGILPRLTLSDGPHGVRRQREGGDALGIGDSVPATCFPPAVALGSSWNRALVGRVGEALGVEARALGVHVLLGPGMNIKRSPLGGRNFEYFSEDPLVTGDLAAALVRGIQSQEVAATPKHFAVNNQETDRMRVSADLDEVTLRELYLPAFERVVKDAQPWALMSAYNRINGTFASDAQWLLTGILRHEWGFDGVVVSDWGAVADRVASLAAGLDLEMPPSGTDERIVAAVTDGRLPESVVDTTVGRLAALTERVSLDEGAPFDADAHHALAREAAADSIVLLKNDGVLPLAPGGRVAVVGEFARTPRYQGGGSSRVVPTRLSTPLDALRAVLGDDDITFAPGYALDGGGAGADDAALAAAAVDAARGADAAVLFLGLPELAESEGFDRTDLRLPADQVALVADLAATGTPLVVVLSNGGIVSVAEWHEHADAVVEGWLLGQAGGEALADVLTGAREPGGRLAETIPVALEDTPAHRFFPGADGHVVYGEGLFVGYRHFDSARTEVAYPFGHGLSYTTFAYRDLAIDDSRPGEWRVSLTVENTGPRAGSDVVQLYVAPVTSATPMRPVHELRGFDKVQLAAGESTRVEIVLDERAFARWDAGAHAWRVDGGDYQIEVGASSRDVRLAGIVTCAASGPERPLTPWSTIEEWRAHPRGAAMIAGAFGGAGAAAAERAPELLRMIAQTPLIKLTSWGLGLTEAHVEAMSAAANAPA